MKLIDATLSELMEQNTSYQIGTHFLLLLFIIKYPHIGV